MSGLDIEKTERQLRELCRRDGIDLHALIKDASVHFQSDVIVPTRLPPGVEGERLLQQMVADEMAFFDETQWPTSTPSP